MTEHTHQNAPDSAVARTAGEKALADWREAVAKEIAALEASDAAPGDADLQRTYKAAVEHSRQVARLAWTRLIEPADVRIRAEVVRHCLWPTYHGERRFEAVLGGKEFGDGLELAEFDERAVAELVKAVLWTVKAAPARSEPPARDWLALLRDAGPNGAAPDPRHAAIWGAILDLRGCRDAIENTVEQMTQRLDRLADETTLTHVIAAGWEPEDEAEAPTPARADIAGECGPRPSQATLDSTMDWQLKTDIEQLWSGITTMHVLINSRRDKHGGLDQDATTSLLFCVDTMSQLSERIDNLLETIEVRSKQPADASAPS